MGAIIGITGAILCGLLAISSMSACDAPETEDTDEERQGEAASAGVPGGAGGEITEAVRASVIWVDEATYGANCSAGRGNQTYNLARACNGLTYCRYAINHRVIGDPAYGCAKEYYARWKCGRGDVRSTTVPAEASGQTVTLRCDP